MDRYRSYGAQDDQPTQVGDNSLLGVDEYNAPENIKPGNVQNAVNVDFSPQDATTRGGFVCLPELGSEPFGIAATWTSRTTPQNKTWVSIASSDTRYVAVQSDGTGANDLMHSTDGVTWTAISTDIPLNWTAVTYGNGIFVAVADGLASFVFGTPSGDTVVTSGSDTIVVDLPYRVMTSYDGLTWTQREVPATYAWSCVAYGANGFIALANGNGGSQQAMTSTDGLTWSIVSTPASLSNHNWRSVVYGSDRYVAVASGGSGSQNRAMYSLDGTTWVAATTPSDPSGCVSVAHGNGVFAAVATTSTSGTIGAMTSSDGITWTPRNTTTDDWTAISFGNATFTAVGNSGTTATSVMASVNGESWTVNAAATGNAWSSIVYGLNAFVAVSTNGHPYQAMTVSPIKSVWASNRYSDPNPDALDQQWIMLAGSDSVGFYAGGISSRTVAYAAGETVTQQATILQANNEVFLFRGPNETPLYWDGNWNHTFVLVPNTTLPSSFNSIPNSSQATFYQNRLWVIDGKDEIAASDILAFTDYDPLANELSTNTGNSDYVVATFPFGQNSLIAFKNKSILLIQNCEGSLSDVTVTEITRQVGLIGINAVCSIGPDLAYASYGNINLLTLTSTNNSLQHKTLPLSAKIRKIMERVNWEMGYKISMGYWNNKLYVALPLDNSEFCNACVVYNFITENWYGEWNFSESMNMCIQGFQVLDYLGLQRLHAITEDGRIFVTDEGYQDISGTTVAEIAYDLTTRAYDTNNLIHFQRRMFMDIGTIRPSYSVYSYTEGANEVSTLIEDQTYSRSESWKFADTDYTLTNANDDYNRPYRKDYSTGPDSIQCGTGFQPEMYQEYRFPLLTRRQGRLTWLQVSNAQGYFKLMSIGAEARMGQRSSLVTV